MQLFGLDEDERVIAETAGAFAIKLPYRFVEVNPDGSLTIGNRIDLVEAPTGEPHTVSFKDKSGKTIANGDAVFTPYDHIGGGYALVPEIDGATSVNIDGLGTAKR